MGNKPSQRPTPTTAEEVERHPASQVLDIIVRPYGRGSVVVIVGTKDVRDPWTQFITTTGKKFVDIVAPLDAVEDFIDGDSNTLTSILPDEADIMRNVVRRGNMTRMPLDSSKDQIHYDADTGIVEFRTYNFKLIDDPNTGKEGFAWVHGGRDSLSQDESVVFLELLSQKFEEFLESPSR